MRILFDNYLIDSTLTATNTNPSYPLANLKHEFIEKIYKGTGTNETVGINFGDDKTVNCCYVGYTNGTAFTLKLYNSADALLSTKVLETTYNCLTFPAVIGVRYASLQIVAPETVYVGNVGIGFSYEMPAPNMGVVEKLVDNSIVVTNARGQTLINKITPLRNVPTSFTTTSQDVYNQVKMFINDNDRPVWVDVFENNHPRIPPIYGRVSFTEQKQAYGVYRFNLDTLEAR
jgi:hypothetical protein